MEASFSSVSSSATISNASYDAESDSKCPKNKSTLQINKEKVDGLFLRDGYIGKQLVMNREYVEALKRRPMLYSRYEHENKKQQGEKKHLAPLSLRKFFRDSRSAYLSEFKKLEDVIVPSCNQGYRLRMLMGATQNKPRKVPPFQPNDWNY